MKRRKKIFQGIARNVEWRNEGKFTVVSFKLEQIDEIGNISKFVPVTVREKKILGSFNDSDEIELGGKIEANGFLKPKIIYNKTTQAYMKQPKLPLVVLLAFLLSFIFLSIHIVSSVFLPSKVPINVLGNSTTVVPTPPEWIEQINGISLYLAFSLFFFAGIISFLRITCAVTPYWLSKLKRWIPGEVRLVLIFSVIFLIGFLILLFHEESKSGHVDESLILIVPFVLLFIIAYSLICGIIIYKARRKMKL